MTGFLAAEDVVDIENIITILIVVAIVFHTLAGLCQHAPWVSRRLVVEVRIADTIGRGQMGCQRLKGLRNKGVLVIQAMTLVSWMGLH